MRENWAPPLFHLGKVPINLTLLVILLQAVGMLAVVMRPEFFLQLGEVSASQIAEGQFLTVLTYPFLEPPSFWLFLGWFFFFSYGGMLEADLGREKYAKLLVSVMLLPVAIVVLLGFAGIPGVLLGSHIPHLSIFVAAIAMMPHVPMAWLNIPIKWLAVVFVGLALLQFVMMRNICSAAALVANCALVVWWMRQHGHVSQWNVMGDILGPRGGSGRAPKRRTKKARLAKRKSYETKLRPRAEIKPSRRQDIDQILDKINEQGLHSLTEEERRILKEASQK